MNRFQLILMGVFAVGGVIGFIFFSANRAVTQAPEGTISGNVTVWGMYPAEIMEPLFNDVRNENPAMTVNYVEKKASAFNAELLEALAFGTGPDLMLLYDKDLVKLKKKITPLEYTSFSDTAFRENYGEAANILLDRSGILGFPITVDPLIIYGNKDILDTAFVPKMPDVWEDVTMVSNTLKTIDEDIIKRSGIAMGIFENIPLAKEIIIALFMQAGSDIAGYNQDGSNYVSLLNYDMSKGFAIDKALEYFASFGDQTKDNYTWNSLQDPPYTNFLRGNSVFYIGYGSEYKSMKQENPLLNIFPAVLPQPKATQRKRTYGRMLMASIPINVKNIAGAYAVGISLSNPKNSAALASVQGTFSLSLANLSTKQPLIFNEILRQSALISRAWFDPDSEATRRIFREMSDGVTSGFLNVGQAINQAAASINANY